MIFHILTVLSLTESGYLYSVGRKKFLSLDMDHIRLVPKHQMPEPFEIEQRGGGDSYRLKIKPSPNQDDKVIDKDWWTNSHRLILHKPTEWESEKFTFALLPKNMIKIVVKGSCILAEESGYVRATDCTDDDNQMYRWIPSKEEAIVEEFVERHGGTIYKKKRDDHSHEDHHKRRNYDEDSDFINPHKIRPSESGGRPEEDSEFISLRRNKKKRYFVEDSDLHERRKRPSHKYEDNDDYDEPRHRPKFDRDYEEPRRRPIYDDEPRRRLIYDDGPRRRPIYDEEPRPNHNYEESDELDDIYYKYKGGRINDPINKKQDSYKKQDSFRNKRYEDDACDSSNRKKLNCDEVVDSIEKVICDIDGLPDFI